MALCLAGAALAQGANWPDAGAAYLLYRSDLAWLSSTTIDGPAALDEALDRGARHAPETLVRGWIAHAAEVAASSPAFAAGVRARVREAGRAAVLRQLNEDITYARRRPQGAAEAMALVTSANATESAEAFAAADRFTTLADALSETDWAMAVETDQVERTAHLHALAPLESGMHATDGALMDRILTLAALKLVDESQLQSARASELLDDEARASCLNFALLELRQCVSATQFPYENAYCLARHGLREPAACLSPP